MAYRAPWLRKKDGQLAITTKYPNYCAPDCPTGFQTDIELFPHGLISNVKMKDSRAVEIIFYAYTNRCKEIRDDPRTNAETRQKMTIVVDVLKAFFTIVKPVSTIIFRHSFSQIR